MHYGIIAGLGKHRWHSELLGLAGATNTIMGHCFHPTRPLLFLPFLLFESEAIGSWANSSFNMGPLFVERFLSFSFPFWLQGSGGLTNHWAICFHYQPLIRPQKWPLCYSTQVSVEWKKQSTEKRRTKFSENNVQGLHWKSLPICS